MTSYDNDWNDININPGKDEYLDEDVSSGNLYLFFIIIIMFLPSTFNTNHHQQFFFFFFIK